MNASVVAGQVGRYGSYDARQREFPSGWKFWLLAFLAHALVFAICAQLYVRFKEIKSRPTPVVVFGPVTKDVQQAPEGPGDKDPEKDKNIEPPVIVVDGDPAALRQAEPDVSKDVTKLLASLDKPALPDHIKKLLIPQPNPQGPIREPTRAPIDAQNSVLRALQYLAKTQNEDGSWGKQYPVAMTGLTVLAFLGHGDTHFASKHNFRTTVNRALTYLLSKVKDGRFTSGYMHYEHGIATYALAEAYAMTKDPQLRPKLERCLNTILEGQTEPGGGWVYNFNKKDNFGDLSISGWQIQALKAAYLADVMPDKIAPALDRATEYVKKVYNSKSKGFGYRNASSAHRTLPSRDAKAPIWSLTGTGVLCLQFWGNADAPEAREALQHLRDNLVFEASKERGPTGDLYGYYYATQALFLGDGPGGNGWRAWEAQFRESLIKTQNENGSFPGYGGGSAEDKTVFGTTLSALMLEVWYRTQPSSLKTLTSAKR